MGSSQVSETAMHHVLPQANSRTLLLKGEEVVTKESFISICWRLIPYWLNNWEQQWGTECSSMMFEVKIKLQTTNLQTTNLPPSSSSHTLQSNFSSSYPVSKSSALG